MRKFLFQLLFPAISFSSFVFASDKPIHTEPLFQFSGGMVYSSIDLSRYSSSVSYRGYHTRVVTHLGNVFFLSTEYSAFPVHEALPSWDNIHTRKIDLNGHVSFATANTRTHVFALAGIDRHEWTGRRTAFADIDQLGRGLAEGVIIKANRWGVNFGCGFTQMLYDNIGMFADSRFCFSNANDFEKVRILDVMTTLGIYFSIPYPDKSRRKKTSGIDRKIYKWTGKGAK